MIYRFSFIVLTLFFSCTNDQSNSCFKIVDDLETVSFINQTNRGIIQQVFFNDGKKIILPSQKKYNYMLHNNFIKNNSFLINRVDKDKIGKEYKYCILEVEKSSVFNVLDSICVKGSVNNGRYISSSSVSNDKTKLALVYSHGNLSSNDKSSLEIIDLNNDKSLLNNKYNKRVFLGKNPWDSNNEHLVFYNFLTEIFVLEIKTSVVKKITSNGSRAMWLQSLNKIAYLKNRNVIAVYDLKTSTEKTFEIKDKLFYKSNIQDYYWFANQNKFYIKTRFSSLLGDKLIPWKNENIILKYEY